MIGNKELSNGDIELFEGAELLNILLEFSEAYF